MPYEPEVCLVDRGAPTIEKLRLLGTTIISSNASLFTASDIDDQTS